MIYAKIIKHNCPLGCHSSLNSYLLAKNKPTRDCLKAVWGLKLLLSEPLVDEFTHLSGSVPCFCLIFSFIPYISPIYWCVYIYIYTWSYVCMYIKNTYTYIHIYIYISRIISMRVYIHTYIYIYITYPIPIQTHGSLLSSKVPVVPEHCATACLSWGHRFVGYVVNGIQPSDLCNWGYPIYLILY